MSDELMTTVVESASVLAAALRPMIESPECQRVVHEIRLGARVISISGLVAAPARALALAALQRETGKVFAVVTQAPRDLELWERDISFWHGAVRGTAEDEDAVAILPASESD